MQSTVSSVKNAQILNVARPLVMLMTLEQLLKPEFTFHNVDGVSRKRTFKFICSLIQSVHPQMPVHKTMEDFIQRERLGSTAIGAGVAIPHIRSAYTEVPIAVLINLRYGIDFDAMDDEHINLIFALVIPETSTQKYEPMFEQILGLFKQQDFLKKLKSAEDNHSLYLNALEGVKLINNEQKEMTKLPTTSN